MASPFQKLSDNRKDKCFGKKTSKRQKNIFWKDRRKWLKMDNQMGDHKNTEERIQKKWTERQTLQYQTNKEREINAGHVTENDTK